MKTELKILDATGLCCPLPVLRARKVLQDLRPGSLLEIHSTDKAAPADFRAFCRETGHSFIEIEQAGEVYKIRLRKRGS